MIGDTIFALSTGQLPCAVAIVRISGRQAIPVLAQFTGDAAVPSARRASLRTLHTSDGGILDDALVLVFPVPHSFTGEDVVELQVTGSAALVERLLAELSRQPECRMAEPGEFARRAFLNGRIDLTEAEGLAALIEAETEAQRTQAMMAADGTVRAHAERWRADLLSIRADVEAALDFGEAEDDVATSLTDAGTERISALRQEIATILSRGEGARRIRRGVDVAVIGSPNAGKSSLVNALSQSEAAIVSGIAGTTRDVIAVPLDIGGYRATLLDTAGLRETEDAIEAEGVRRAMHRAESADIRIRLLLQEESAPKSEDIMVRSMRDKPISLASDSIHVSAHTGEGLDLLFAAIAAQIAKGVGREDLVATSARQVAELNRTEDALRLAEGNHDPVLCAEHLRAAADALGALTGHVTSEDVLGEIFGRFCIGK